MQNNVAVLCIMNNFKNVLEDRQRNERSLFH